MNHTGRQVGGHIISLCEKLERHGPGQVSEISRRMEDHPKNVRTYCERAARYGLLKVDKSAGRFVYSAAEGWRAMVSREEPAAPAGLNQMELVTSIVEEAGSGTIESVLKQCPGLTRQQVMQALQNARHNQLIRRVGFVGIPGVKGGKMAVYEPMPDEPEEPKQPYVCTGPRITSVWDLGAAA